MDEKNILPAVKEERAKANNQKYILQGADPALGFFNVVDGLEPGTNDRARSFANALYGSQLLPMSKSRSAQQVATTRCVDSASMFPSHTITNGQEDPLDVKQYELATSIKSSPPVLVAKPATLQEHRDKNVHEPVFQLTMPAACSSSRGSSFLSPEPHYQNSVSSEPSEILARAPILKVTVIPPPLPVPSPMSMFVKPDLTSTRTTRPTMVKLLSPSSLDGALSAPLARPHCQTPSSPRPSEHRASVLQAASEQMAQTDLAVCTSERTPSGSTIIVRGKLVSPLPCRGRTDPLFVLSSRPSSLTRPSAGLARSQAPQVHAKRLTPPLASTGCFPEPSAGIVKVTLVSPSHQGLQEVLGNNSVPVSSVPGSEPFIKYIKGTQISSMPVMWAKPGDFVFGPCQSSGESQSTFEPEGDLANSLCPGSKPVIASSKEYGPFESTSGVRTNPISVPSFENQPHAIQFSGIPYPGVSSTDHATREPTLINIRSTKELVAKFSLQKPKHVLSTGRPGVAAEGLGALPGARGSITQGFPVPVTHNFKTELGNEGLTESRDPVAYLPIAEVLPEKTKQEHGGSVNVQSQDNKSRGCFPDSEETNSIKEDTAVSDMLGGEVFAGNLKVEDGTWEVIESHEKVTKVAVTKKRTRGPRKRKTPDQTLTKEERLERQRQRQYASWTQPINRQSFKDYFSDESEVTDLEGSAGSDFEPESNVISETDASSGESEGVDDDFIFARTEPRPAVKGPTSMFTVDLIAKILQTEIAGSDVEMWNETIKTKFDDLIFEDLIRLPLGKRRFKCWKCDDQIHGTSNSVSEHMKNEHASELVFGCFFCPLARMSERALRKHEMVHLHYVTTTSCPICDYWHSISMARMPEKLEATDLRAIHAKCHQPVDVIATYPPKDQIFEACKCISCPEGRQLTTPVAFKGHMYKFHVDIDGICYLCGAVMNFWMLQGHINDCKVKHGEKLCCELCGTEFQYRNRFADHNCTGKYDCKICGAKFTQSNGIRRHMRNLHGNPRQHTCDQCGRSFKDPYVLKDHFNTHTGAKPYQCLACGTRHTSHAGLAMHLRARHDLTTREMKEKYKNCPVPEEPPSKPRRGKVTVTDKDTENEKKDVPKVNLYTGRKRGRPVVRQDGENTAKKSRKESEQENVGEGDENEGLKSENWGEEGHLRDVSVYGGEHSAEKTPNKRGSNIESKNRKNKGQSDEVENHSDEESEVGAETSERLEGGVSEPSNVRNVSKGKSKKRPDKKAKSPRKRKSKEKKIKRKLKKTFADEESNDHFAEKDPPKKRNTRNNAPRKVKTEEVNTEQVERIQKGEEE